MSFYFVGHCSALVNPLKKTTKPMDQNLSNRIVDLVGDLAKTYIKN